MSNETKGANFPYGETVIFTVVWTSEGRWGRACHNTCENPLWEALNSAQALRPTLGKKANPKFDLRALRPRLRIGVCTVTVRPKDRCTPTTVESAAAGGLILEGFKPGDVVPPFLNDHGGLVRRGEVVELGQINT